MTELQELLTEAQELVNRSIQDIEWGNVGLKEVEERVVELVNRVGGLLVDQIVEGIREPVLENRVWVDGKRAKYKDSDATSFINRFGTKIRRKRRGYQIEGERGRWYPLDEKLGTDRCCGYSPLMSYLLSFFGSSEAYRPS